MKGFKIKSFYKKLIFLISVILVLVGFVPQLTINIFRDLSNPYTIEHLPLESEDGTYISSFIYTPMGEKNHGGIVLTHRYWGDKTLMEPLSIELVRRGFTVICIDLRGHGASRGQFNQEKLIYDLKAAVDYLDFKLPNITQIALAGHSLGAIVSAEFARAYPNRINATVAIGSLRFNPLGISNLLLMFGRYQEFSHKEELLRNLRIYTGRENVTIGQLYDGDFIGGNNIMAFVGDYFGHLSEAIDPSIMYQTIQWFEQVFNGAPAEDIFLTEWYLEFFSPVSHLGAIIFIFILMVFLSNQLLKNHNEHKEREIFSGTKNDVGSLVSYFTLIIMGFALIIFNFLLDSPTDPMQLNTASSILVLYMGISIGTFIVYIFLIMNIENKFSFRIYYFVFKKMSLSNFKRSLVFGTASSLVLIFFIVIFWNLPYLNLLFVGKNFGILIVLIVISFPLFLIKEFYFRIIQDKIHNKRLYVEYIKMVFGGILMENLIIVMIFSVGWAKLVYITEIIPYLSVWMRFSIIQQIFASWIYIFSGRNILSSALFSSIIYAWLSVIAFPSYGFL